MAKSKKSSVHGKRFLLTSYSFSKFGGAELNTVELADYLVDNGAEVDFFSYDIEGPLARFMEKKFGKKIYTDRVHALRQDENDLQETVLPIEGYDYIWVGANTIPISIIRQINTAKQLPKFLFIHMSPLVGFPLDAPLLPELENKIATRALTISEVNTEKNIHRILGDKIEVADWLNPVPVEYKKLTPRSGELKKIAVINSSHPTNEVLEIGKILANQGVEVEYIGKYAGNHKLVDAELYDKYDLIIGIGKNAKYSLVSGVPIYLYGRFGGPGYLTDSNLTTTATTNFSGRGFEKKTSTQIATEIIDSYGSALAFHEKNRDAFIEQYSIDVVAESLFSKLNKEQPKKVKFSNQYINWLVSMQINLMQRLQNTAEMIKAREKVAQLERQLIAKNKEIIGIYNSKSWKITKPFRAIVKLLKGEL